MSDAAIPEMTAVVLVEAIAYVQDRFPHSVPVCQRPGKIDFYPRMSTTFDIPIAVIDMALGKVTEIMNVDEVTFSSSYPGLARCEEVSDV